METPKILLQVARKAAQDRYRKKNKQKLKKYYKNWYAKNGRKRKPRHPCPKCGKAMIKTYRCEFCN